MMPLFLLGWAALHLLVGAEMSSAAPNGLSWGFHPGDAAIACAGLAALLASRRVRLEDPRHLWALVALSSVLLTLCTVHLAVVRIARFETGPLLPNARALLLLGLVLFFLYRVWLLGRLALLLLVLTAAWAVASAPGCYLRERCQGPVTACKSNLKNIGTALEMYSTDNGGRFPPALSALAPNYLTQIPSCPTIGRETYSISYERHADPDAYTVYCAGFNHGGSGLGPDLPAYTSTQGLLDRWPEPHKRRVAFLAQPRLEEGFSGMKLLILFCALPALFDRRIRVFGLAALGFALIPWAALVNLDARPVAAYNDCVTALLTHSAHGPCKYEIETDADGRVTVVCRSGHPMSPPGYPRYVQSEDRVLGEP
jgi:hypothetical protein